MALTKHDIVRQVQEMGYTPDKSGEIVESLLEIIKSSLENGEDVLVSGFGKFSIKEKPQEGEETRQPARTCTLMHERWWLLNVRGGCGRRLMGVDNIPFQVVPAITSPGIRMEIKDVTKKP